MKTSLPKPCPTVLITGASGGIGLELAKIFARHDFDLVLVARGEDKLRRLARELGQKVQVKVVVKDLALPGAVKEIVDELRRESIDIDILVNNAGFGAYGEFAETDLDAELRMIAVNITALTHLTKLLLPPMIERRRGKILNVASTAAFQPGPLMAVYYATKAYVLSFSEALFNELQGSGVGVTTLCPGLTKSDFQKEANLEESRLMRGVMMDAATVAAAGYRGLMRDRRIVIPGLNNQVFGVLSKFLPRPAVLRIVRRAQEKHEL